MIRNYHNSRGSTTHVGHAILRWRRVFWALVLALALAVGATGQPWPAQAAPGSATELRYFMEANKVRGTALICVGDQVAVDVHVIRAQVTKGVAVSAELISGAKVTGSVQDSSIGTLSPPTNWTGWDREYPGTAYFTFYAKKPGTTTISFEGRIRYGKNILELILSAGRNDLVSDIVDVTVQDCNYKVTVTSNWSRFGVKHVAMIVQAEMTADAPGHYKGTATVNWVISQVLPVKDCPLRAVTSTSQADLTGVLDKDGQQLLVDVAYQLLDAYWYTYLSDNCPIKSSSERMLYTPAPLTLSVPASGGASTQSQALVHQMFPVMNKSGSADVTVIRVGNQ